MAIVNRYDTYKPLFILPRVNFVFQNNQNLMLKEDLTSGQLPSRLLSLKGSREPLVVLFFASANADGKRWCGDCEEAEPVLEEAYTHAGASVRLLNVEISHSEWKEGNWKEHFLRKEPYSVTGIPTLVLWDSVNNKPTSTKFLEADLLQLENISEFFRNLQTND